MKKILLVCAAGMSTSMLVKRMIDHANAISLEVNGTKKKSKLRKTNG